MITTMYRHLLNFIAPPSCTYCKLLLSQRSVFCDDCSMRIAPVVTAKLPVTKKYVVKVLALSQYQEPLKTLVLAKGRSDIIASRQLGELLWEKTNLKHMEFDYVIPVPLHWVRFAKRGYNQAEEIARVLSKKSGRELVRAIKRTRNTALQSSHEKEGRLQNVKGAFAVNKVDKLQYQGKHLVLVDDVMTTGATLQMAARELIKLKPASITAVVACRVV
jgi:ComF family protein